MSDQEHYEDLTAKDFLFGIERSWNSDGTPYYEHAPWLGEHYEAGIRERRILIMGNSHYIGPDEEDRNSVTNEVVSKVVSGEYRIAFFDRIRDYFGFSDHEEFWSRVMFANYVPSSIGSSDDRYAQISVEQAQVAKERLPRIVSVMAPNIVLIFSTKIRWALPKYEWQPMPSKFPNMFHAVMRPKGVPAEIFMLRHPQGARNEVMAGAMNYILSRTIAR